MKKYAVIVAGGKGVRMSKEMPKQFLLLRGKPILMHTLLSFYHSDPEIQIILVLSDQEIGRWQQLCQKYQFDVPYKLAAGGHNRTESVRNGLKSIPEERGLVAIHDGVRPLVNAQIITDSFAVAEKKGNAVVSVKLKDSIRWDDGYENKSLDRSQYRIVQTPQTFDLAQIRGAYDRLGEMMMTDDASVLEAAGHQVNLIEGDYRNIKITTPEDLKIAEALWE